MPDAEVQRPVRTQFYWDLHDFSHGRGFELGPLFNPIVSRSEADVRYVDVFDTEQLRTSYTHDPNVDISKIVDVDVRLGRDDGSVATLSEALGPEAPFDWAMASHVVEHVPDLIGWLADVAAVVADGGVLVLAVPDKRYTFDIHRPLTTTGQLLEAHEAHVDRPGTRAVYDHCRASTTVDLVALWNGADPPDYRSRDYTVEQVAELVGKARAGEYIDTHVWVFRPDSFLEHLYELRGLGLVEWSVEELVETEPLQHEFRVRLRRIPRGTDVREALSDDLVPALDMPGWQRDVINGRHERAALEVELAAARADVESATSRAVAAETQLESAAILITRLQARLEKAKSARARLRARNGRLRVRVRQLKQRRARLRRKLRRRTRDLEAMRASTQWRVGGQVLRPIRWVRRDSTPGG
jgi:hypothetical protein